MASRVITPGGPATLTVATPFAFSVVDPTTIDIGVAKLTGQWSLKMSHDGVDLPSLPLFAFMATTLRLTAGSYVITVTPAQPGSVTLSIILN